MHYPQLLVYEHDGYLAALLRPLAEARQPHWFLREPRQLRACVRLLRRAEPALLVLKVGADVVQEMTLLERVLWLCPDTTAVVVGDHENDPLGGLAWHLGACAVLMPPRPRSQTVDVVGALMDAALTATAGPAAEPELPPPGGDGHE